MNHLENEYFQKEVDTEIKRQNQEISKRYEDTKSIDGMKAYLSEETQKMFKKAFVYLISLSSDQIQLNSEELTKNREQLKEKEEANQKILAKMLDFKAFLDSFP